jgi:peptidoglycan/LPS O-acetylase OafA/YrhL
MFSTAPIRLRERPAADTPALGPRPAVRRHIAGLDGIRAIAAGLVLVFHYWALTGRRPLPEPFRMIAMNGGLGVDIFFVISGFILFLPWARAAWTGARVEVRRFLRNRFLRIVPAYWFNTAVLVLVTFPALLFSADGLRSLLLYGSFLAGFAPPSQVAHLMLNPVAWTLCIEVAFYLVLPFVGRLFVRDRWMIALPVVLAVTIAFKALMIARYGHLENTVVLSVATRNIVAMFGEFAVGMVVAAIWAKLEFRCVLRLPRGVGMACTVAGLAGIVATLYVNQYRIGREGFLRGTGDLGWWPMLTLFQILAVFAGLVLFGVCYQPNVLTRLLSLRPIAYLGTISYGIYLWHYPVGQWLAEGVGVEMSSRRMLLALLVAGTAVTVGVATFSYRFVEQPFLLRKAPVVSPSGAGARARLSRWADAVRSAA